MQLGTNFYATTLILLHEKKAGRSGNIPTSFFVNNQQIPVSLYKISENVMLLSCNFQENPLTIR